MRVLLLIFFGGGIGSLGRYLVNRWITGLLASTLPYGTFIVNVTGCFLIGFLVFVTERTGANALYWRLLLVTGFCGGYTTFSSVSFENAQLITDHQILMAVLYAAASIVTGLLATFLGILLARNL